MEGSNWHPIKSNRMWTFQLGEEPEVMHVIEGCGTSPRGKIYIVLFEDAYELSTGETEISTKEEIEKKYKVKLE
jgi:hypothetical protein